MKKIFLLLIISVFLISFIPSVMAHCPLCTGAAVAGVEVARVTGLDDSIVGLLLGGVIISSALWFNKWLKKKVNFPMQGILIIILSFVSIAVPLYYAGMITNFDMVKSMPDHHSILGLGVFGIDKLLFGMILGSLSLMLVFRVSDDIKKSRGKVLWPYQGLSFMAITLSVLTFTLWLLTK